MVVEAKQPLQLWQYRLETCESQEEGKCLGSSDVYKEGDTPT
jgi:hypothetical protein